MTTIQMMRTKFDDLPPVREIVRQPLFWWVAGLGLLIMIGLVSAITVLMKLWPTRVSTALPPSSSIISATTLDERRS